MAKSSQFFILREGVALIAMIVFAIGWPINVLVGSGGHYIIGGALSVIFLFFTIRGKFVIVLIVYIFFVIMGLAIHMIIGNVNEYTMKALIPYLVLPIIFGRQGIISDDSFEKLFYAFSIISIINVIGIYLQNIGLASFFFKGELTRTAGETHVRYTGFMGAALALGYVALLSFIAGIYGILKKESHKFFHIIVMICSLVGIYFSFARRYYVVAALSTVLLMLITKNDKVRGITRRVIAISVVILSIMILFNYTSSGTIGIKRGVSVFDFSKDEGNVARLKSWYLALRKIEESAPFGLGFGATGTIGRKKAPIGGIANVYSTESRYLQVFLEGGVFVGIAFLILVVWTAYKGLKIRSRVNVLSYAIFIAISAESIMGGALEAPVTSLVYWISFAQIYQSIEKKNEYLKEDLIKVEIPMPRVG